MLRSWVPASFGGAATMPSWRGTAADRPPSHTAIGETDRLGEAGRQLNAADGLVTDGGAQQEPAQIVRTKRYRRFGLHNMRAGFREWRRSRPFWAGLWSILAGLFIMAGPLSAFKVIFIAGVVVVGILVGVLVSIFGLFLWFAPAQRHFFGVLIVLASIVSFFTSDFGGFVLGMLLGMIGGSMGFAWVPVAAGRGESRRRRFRLRTVMSGTRATGARSQVGEPVAPEAVSSTAPASSDAGDPATVVKRPSDKT